MTDDEIVTLTSPGHLVMNHGVFGPMNSKIKSYPIIGFDTEDDTRGLPLSFAFHDGNESFYTRNADKAIDYIYNYPDTAIFMAHNLEYDIGNLFKHCEYRYVKEMVYASRLLKVSLIGTSHFFLNTSSFFAGSLAKMGKIVGIEKLDGDPLNKEYNIRDAEIVQVFGAKFQTKLNSRGVNLGLSIGQISMNIYRTNFLHKKQRTYNSKRCLEAYYGGRVELFYKGALPGPIYVSDINSSYPDVMRRYEYPDTSFIEDSSIHSHEFGVGHFTIKVPDGLFIPVLPVHSESNRLFFPKGIVKGWWTYAEVRYAVSLGCEIVAEHEGEGTNKSCRPFVDFIDTHYDERQMWKRRKKLNEADVEAAFEDLTLKLIMNNLYGKFGQHKDASKMTRIKMSPNELKKIGAHIEHKRGPFYSYRMPREKPPKTANYMWAAYVTSYARISLHEKLQAVHDAGGILLYCDTDSVMFTGGEKARAALKFGDELGLMSLEKFDYAIFRASKGYLLCDDMKKVYHYSKGRIFCNGKEIAHGIERRERTDALCIVGPPKYRIKKVACKGVPTHLARDFILKGMASVLKPMRLKEAEIRLHADGNKGKDAAFFRDVGVNVWREVNKWMRSVYIKRQGEVGITYPIDAADIPELEEKAFGPSTGFDLGDAEILDDKKKTDLFRSVKVPDDWFNEEKDLEEQEHKYFNSQETHFLKREECLELNPGDSWFRGEIMERKVGRFGRYYILFLKTYLGKNVVKKNIIAAISEKYFYRFGPDVKIYRKQVEFFLLQKYNGNTDPLMVRIEILG